MTENEYLEMPWSIEDTIENLKIIEEHLIATVLKANLDDKGKQDAREVEFDFNRAIKALEEIQQYRAIGTVEYFKLLKGHYQTLNEMCKEYSAIGTVEEFKALKEKNTPKKGIPYTSSNNHKFVECPNCHKDMDLYYDYCQYCGQLVDWGKSKI